MSFRIICDMCNKEFLMMARGSLYLPFSYDITVRGGSFQLCSEKCQREFLAMNVGVPAMKH